MAEQRYQAVMAVIADGLSICQVAVTPSTASTSKRGTRALSPRFRYRLLTTVEN
ncbi:hypothetical protein [Mycobacterium camsae]|uniref:hypothetical protein n=1 Tax=Mycobacterium gordonae TaxID=1778 RepID=UPI00198269EB|nr:hypothetical protein [Mycobacterium gordonae]